ncbi:MAG: DUF2493 domain-containing protein [Ruminococcaceae bacterium]|nr:DUF2493 domain-containing protein [Oscillospiraceae bacterium]
MTVLIVGSRSIKNFDLSGLVPKETTLIISGGAKGIDTKAEEFADKNRIDKLIMRPQYAKYGRAAPLKRNEEMVKLADLVLVIWDGSSKGTKYTIDYAQKLRKKTIVKSISKAQ